MTAIIVNAIRPDIPKTADSMNSLLFNPIQSLEKNILIKDKILVNIWENL